MKTRFSETAMRIESAVKQTEKLEEKLLKILASRKLDEADPPPQGSLASAIPGTPETLQPRPTRAQIIKSRQRARKLRKWMNG